MFVSLNNYNRFSTKRNRENTAIFLCFKIYILKNCTREIELKRKFQPRGKFTLTLEGNLSRGVYLFSESIRKICAEPIRMTNIIGEEAYNNALKIW